MPTDLAQATSAVIEASRRAARRRDAATLEDRGTVEVAACFRAQGRAFAAEAALLRPTFTEARVGLSESPSMGEWMRAWRSAAASVRARFEDALDGIAARGLSAGFASMIAELDATISLDLANPRAVAFMAEHGAALVSRIDEVTRGRLAGLLEKAIDEGWSYDRVARQIKTTFEGFSAGSPLKHIRSRAHLVAVTENAFAYEQGTKLAAGQVRDALPPGLGMQKQWITAGDNRVDEFPCGASESDGWIGYDAEFSGGFGEPPAHPGCRCTCAYGTMKVGA